MRFVAALLLFAFTISSWAQHEHHGRAMKTSSTARIELADDAAIQTMVVRVGPLDLPAHSDHMTVAQAPRMDFTIPFDGWLTGYHPRLVDSSGGPLPGRLLHHVGFYNRARPDFLCPNKSEHIFGAGGEMNDWAPIAGFGYRVHKGDKVRVDTMFHNPTDTSYPDTWMEVKVDYRMAGNGEPLRSVYPAWLDVQVCGNSGYDLRAGENVTTGTYKLEYSGFLLGVGGHLHDYGTQLELSDTTHAESIATLKPQVDAHGHIAGMPVVRFKNEGGYKLAKGDVLKVTSIYDNTSGKPIPDGAMGIIVGYFLPEEDAQIAALKK
jgi:hypothetical protein